MEDLCIDPILPVKMIRMERTTKARKNRRFKNKKEAWKDIAITKDGLLRDYQFAAISYLCARELGIQSLMQGAVKSYLLQRSPIPIQDRKKLIF